METSHASDNVLLVPPCHGEVGNKLFGHIIETQSVNATSACDRRLGSGVEFAKG